MRSSTTAKFPKASIVVEEVTDNDEEVYSTQPEHDEEEKAHYENETNPGAVYAYDENRARASANAFRSSIQQQTKTTDDSRTAYGEGFASSFGQRGIAPMPEPSAPPMGEKDWDEYQQWMHAGTFADRSKFRNHERWSQILNHGQAQFHLPTLELLKDRLSEDFIKNAISRHPELFNGSGNPPDYTEMETYVPPVFIAQIAKNQAGPIDQVQEMMDYSDKLYKSSYISGVLVGQEIPSNQFYVLSDHNGESSGRDLQLWGPGTKKGFTLASTENGKNLGKVQGSAASYSTTTEYAHVPNRFTIIRINNNELGFIVDRATSTIKKMKAGRYVIQEKDFAYLGKATLKPGVTALLVKVHADNKDNYVASLAKELEIILVTTGKIAFVKDNNNTYILTSRNEPYILDKRRYESFINFANTNQQILKASDGSYTLISQLQPGQLTMFQYQNKLIVWPYSARSSIHNTLHLQANKFVFDSKIYTTNDNHILWGESAHVINMKPGQVLVIRDERQQVRFIEDTVDHSIVIRTPWQLLGLISKNQVDYRAGTQAAGNEVARLMLRSSEWAAVIDKTGHLAFYPPRLDNKPYYFLQPEHTVVQIINKNTLGETKLEVPGIGSVSVVNIPSGSIGACRLHNMHFFLNPSAVPYVFVPPDAFIKIIDAKQAHNQIEDLHRIVLKPDERAIISKDGKLYRLPASNSDDSRELSEENGVYVFRSFQLEMYGPEKKSRREYTLGPIQYFNVGVGEVAYGTLDRKLKIWEAGEHSVDNRKNEWFTGFFSTNVDPVEIDKLEVTFQHGITGTVGVYVSYHIVNSEKAINQFRDHQTLHQFILKTTQSEMIKLCASRPPLGYTDLYFGSNESKSEAEGSTADASEAVHEIEDSFMNHAAELLEQYGVHISKMYIDSWALAEDFVKQVQANAKLLQDAHAKVEQTRMGLQQSKLTNDQEIQRREAEVLLKRSENERLKLELEATQLRRTSESKSEADAKVASAEATTTISVNQAKARKQIAEEEAGAKTAAQRVESEIIKSIAQNKLEARRSEIEASKLEINTEKEKGLYEAEILAAKTQARYAGLTAEQRMQLEYADIQMKNSATLVQMLLQTGVQMPGAVTLDPSILQLLRVPQLINAQQSGVNASNPFMLFTPPQPAKTSLAQVPAPLTDADAVKKAPGNMDLMSL